MRSCQVDFCTRASLPAGEIAYARECPEHFAKVAFAAPPVLQMAAPLLRGFAPMMSSDDQTQPWWELESRSGHALSRAVGGAASCLCMAFPCIWEEH